MTGEFPEPESTYYVLETNRLDGGGSVTVFAAGPYLTPDEAKTAREQLHSAEPVRNLHCAEYRTYE
ncbi:hypothetical protein [Salinisphaera sp.]|uniref:hypothetical protein n=1 Tax=Salinisphaera sp. TaxID=1914330 RepID=UPI000C5F5AF4|nr:hypothetical protein [Salinisphaera sp.]MAS10314.1 hypothetical protein [Salinisphaera sp.]|tara:strand:+ start:3808 stop:4005 length:198 start_codon:yes stop_codon:yes gene_type:complete